jgi:hypothetical protein
MMSPESGAVFSYARLATIRAISAHSRLIRKVRKYSCLGTHAENCENHMSLPFAETFPCTCRSDQNGGDECEITRVG